jgi:hypothetical protein
MIVVIARNQRTIVRRVRPTLPSQRPYVVLTLCGSDECARHTITISTLPDDVLLNIFDFCRKDEDHAIYCAIHCIWKWKNSSWNSWEWHLLVHVCRRWRELVFASPRRLNLRIPFTRSTPVGKNLGIWPALPIDLDFDVGIGSTEATREGLDNFFAALKHLDRVYHVRLSLLGSKMKKIVTAMQEPFPVLTRLFITSHWHNHEDVPALPANFLGGSAPRLQAIGLFCIPYPALPTLLLSTSDLVKLDLRDIPLAGYISPEAMVGSLAALPKLEIFVMKFYWSAYRHYRTGPPPVTRTTLPALAYFVFRGASEYLEDLVGRIDSPRLNHISICTLNRPQVAQISRFINQSVGSKLAQCRHAEVLFHYSFFGPTVTFNFCHRPENSGQDSTTIISYEGIRWEDTQVLRQLPITLSNVIHLQIKCDPDSPPTGFTVPVGLSIQLFQLIRPFSTMQTLHIDSQLSGFVASILGHVPDVMMTEALPYLELLCLEEYCQYSVQVDKFIAARRRSDHPVTIVNTNKEFMERLESYIGKNE